MFRAEFESAKAFKKVVDTLSTLLDEITIKIDEEGMKAIAMDPSHVALVKLEVPKLAFDSYEIDEEKEIGIDLEMLKKIFNRAKAKDKLILELDEEKNKLNIIFENTGKRKFSISLLETGGITHKVPEIEYVNKVMLKGDAFKEALKDAKLFSDSVTLKIDEEKFVVYAKSEVNEVESIFDKDSSAVISLECGEEAKSSFNLEYLEDMVKGVSSGDIVKIELGNDMPLKLEYSLSGAELLFFLAPRIEEE
ncbi:DNA polymerase sliding clamp [Methanocaldococcus indicus]|uniref:DNA polymerase sliding clamp n=1 Tax=Methanocaldococcus indicus TaxID=213231 RepID=UPI003C6D90BD